MKYLFFAFLVIALMVKTPLQSQDTIPNAGFEHWSSNTIPLSWQTTNDLLPFGVFNCNQTSNSYEGAYALQLKTIDLDGLIVPAVATLGGLDVGFTYGGIPFNQRPLSLNGYFRHPTVGDEVMVGVQFCKEGTEIGGGLWITSDPAAEFTQFQLPITFTTTDYPDTLNITILTDQFIVGSSLTIDGLSFEFQATNTEMHEGKYDDIICFPNPTKDFVNVQSGNDLEKEIILTNIQGKILNRFKVVKDQFKLDLRPYPQGVYVVNIISGKKVRLQRIIKY
jgi:hypothetical protein